MIGVQKANQAHRAAVHAAGGVLEEVRGDGQAELEVVRGQGHVRGLGLGGRFRPANFESA